jgi:hypothetical protein
MYLVNKNNKSKITFKRRFFYKHKNLSNINYYYNLDAKYIDLKKKNMLYVDKYNIIKNIFIYEKEEYNKEDNNISKKKSKERKSKYLKYKKYFQELEWKSTTPIDVNKLTLWSKKGLGKENMKMEYIKGENYFKYNKYSLDQFKKKIYYAKGKVKRKVSPRI